MEELISKFNLPTYIKGKSFSDASVLIEKKFKDRDDPEAVATKKELMGRLRQAQDYVKSFMAPPQKEASQEETPADAGDFDPVQRSTDYSSVGGQNQNFMGGILGKAAGSAGASKLGSAAGSAGGSLPTSGGPSVGGALGQLEGVADIAGTYFGKPNIDTSGATAAPEDMSGVASAATGAMKGAEIGQIAGPYGAAAGAVIGGVGGIIQAGKHNKSASEARKNNTYANASEQTNTFREGGFLDKIFGKKQTAQGDNPMIDYNQIDADLNAGTVDDARRFTPDEVGDLPITIPSTATNPTVGGNKPDLGLIAGQAARYAPIATNALQLATLDKPDEEGLGRLGNRYEKQTTDKQFLQNIISGQTAGNREAILNASGGSGSTARANLLANNLQGVKATSDAYFDALRADQGENRTEQQFNLGVDQINLQQGNVENDINARNKGNYDTQKSKLIAQIGQDMGAVGKEELFKKYPELMGSDYNWLGKYKKSK